MTLVYASYADIPHPVRVRMSTPLCPDSDGYAAVARGTLLRFRLCAARALCAENVTLEIVCDDDGSTRRIPLAPESNIEYEDYFSADISSADLCIESGLFFYRYSMDTPYGKLYTDAGDGDAARLRADASGDAYQLTVYPAGKLSRAPISGGVMYQIFVDRFARSEEKGVLATRNDAVFAEDWYDDVSQYSPYPGAHVENNLFYGGSLWGVVEKLDYLQSLSVDTIYLCPIFEAYSNHKYDTGDYEKVDAMFGGNEALDALLDACRARGMRVVLDGVFNHTGSISRYFNADGRYGEGGAARSTSSPYYPWYSFDHYPDRYRAWWGVRTLPAVNGTEPTWQNYIAGAGGIVDTYLSRGVSGFRLDVVDELNEDFLRKIRDRAEKTQKDAFLIGEVWEDASNKIAYGTRRRYFRGGELDSVMNYPVKNAIIDYLLYGDADAFAVDVRRLYAHYPRAVGESLMNILGTHDTARILNVLSGEAIDRLSPYECEHYRLPAAARARARRRLMCAYAILSFLPGTPCIYYGDEAGMEGCHDPFNRKGFPWGREDEELLAFYRKIGKLRRDRRALFTDGRLRILSSDGGLLLMERYRADERIFLAVNRSGKPRRVCTGGFCRPLGGDGAFGRSFVLADEDALIFTVEDPENG